MWVCTGERDWVLALWQGMSQAQVEPTEITYASVIHALSVTGGKDLSIYVFIYPRQLPHVPCHVCAVICGLTSSLARLAVRAVRVVRIT